MPIDLARIKGLDLAGNCIDGQILIYGRSSVFK